MISEWLSLGSTLYFVHEGFYPVGSLLLTTSRVTRDSQKLQKFENLLKKFRLVVVVSTPNFLIPPKTTVDLTSMR